MIRLVTCLLLLLPLAATAEMYKWVDKDGKVHYSQTPPPKGQGAKAQKINPPPAPMIGNVPPPSADAPAAGANLQQYVDDVSKSNAERDAARGKQQQEQAERAQDCERARSRLAMFDRYARIGTVASDGSVQAWDEGKRESERAAAQRDVDANCR